MRIGVAIPCYNKHIPYLKICLDSIAAQTCLPSEVVVSCSSTTYDEIPQWKYPFHLQILTFTDVYNPAKNRNIAASQLTTDIITFFDADDIMHPQRIELLKNAFETHWCDIILHGFMYDNEKHIEFPLVENSTSSFILNNLVKAKSGCAIVKDNWKLRIHHAHVSISAAIFRRNKFNEDPAVFIKEDCDYCARVLSLPNIRSVYINVPLSRYMSTPVSLTVIQRESMNAQSDQPIQS